MVEFPGHVWLALALIGAACTVAFLHALADAVRHERRMHELRIRSAELRRQYAAQSGQSEDVIEVDEAPPPSIPMPPTSQPQSRAA